MLQGVKSSHVITVLRRSSKIGKMCTNNCYKYRCEKTLKGVSVTYSRLRGTTDDDRSREDAAPWRHHEAPQHGKRLGYSRLRLERGIRFRYLVLGWVHFGTWDLYDIPGLSRMRGFADKETPGTPFEQWHAVTAVTKTSKDGFFIAWSHSYIYTGFHWLSSVRWWTMMDIFSQPLGCQDQVAPRRELQEFGNPGNLKNATQGGHGRLPNEWQCIKRCENKSVPYYSLQLHLCY